MSGAASVAARALLVAGLLAAATAGWTLAASRTSCERARADVARVASGGAGGGERLDGAVGEALRTCPDAGDRLLLVQSLAEGPPAAVELARAVAARTVRAEPRRAESRQAALLVARPGAERDRAVAALRRLDPRVDLD